MCNVYEKSCVEPTISQKKIFKRNNYMYVYIYLIRSNHVTSSTFCGKEYLKTICTLTANS